MNKRNTIQKETVARIVKEACDHPTAEMVFEKAKVELPNISLGTVYRILKDMAHEGELREVVCKDAPSRFDKTTMDHAHFTCVQCGGVDDVFINTDNECRLAILLQNVSSHNADYTGVPAFA